MINTILTKLFGSKSEKDLKKIVPIVEQINEIYDGLSGLSDEELKAKTIEFKEIIKENTKELEDEKEALHEKLRNEALIGDEIQDINDRVKQLDKELFSTINSVLDEILPEAFAVVRETCRRLKERMHRYEYAGQSVVWDMVPYDVQLIGGVVLHKGFISEMATGEGKTLVAVLPMYLNALAGKGVHLVTVNDYLAKRDSEWMKPIFEFLGLSVGAIQSNMDSDERKKIYNLDITYGTNNEFGFDYLRDNMVVEAEQMVQREHWYAIVDEVDSVLIDEARTPLIISGPVGQSDQKFDEMNPRVKRLVDAQTKLINRIAQEAEELLKSEKKEDIDQAGVNLLRSFRGLPKHKKLMKLLQEPENLKLMRSTELLFLRDQGQRMHEIDEELFYTIDEKNHNIDIHDKGRQLMCSAQEEPDMFIIPDIASQLSMLENETELTPDKKQKKIDEINVLYAERSDRIHTISQLLRAYSLYEKDVEYVIQEDKIMIVDEHTGRILEGRRYSEGLHQAIEAKENVKVERDTQTLATITLQNYFRLYKKLAGMTGTAETEASEFIKIYNLDVIVIPTNKPIIRTDNDDYIYKTKREKYNSIIDEIEKILKDGRAILVGTASVEVSELLSKMLKRKGIHHNVLNAKQHQREAEIIAHAGNKGSVTIATNMAGRGTDIKLDHDVRKNGGLAIVGTERHDARRIDRQLMGRSGRQGDPGSSQFFISLEDNLMRLFGGDKVAGIMQRMKIPEGEPIQHSMMSKSVERAQRKVEENNFGIRKRLLEYDNVMNQQREVIYNRRRAALRGERLKGELFSYIEELAELWFEEFHPENDIDGLKRTVRTTLLCDLNISADDFESMKADDCVDKILESADKFYKRKEETLGSEFMSHLERVAVLQTIDDKWREHLRVMDELKEGIHLRAYGQKDPLLEYKGEAFSQFMELIKDINSSSVNFAFKYFPQVVERQVRVRGAAPREAEVGADGIPRLRRSSLVNTSAMQFSHPTETPAFLQQGGGREAAAQGVDTQQKVRTYKKTEKEVGRNEPCPCGSGKKYKHCHGRNQ
ncbi:MAG: preprotein translocase subunit SecA [Ignavibacteria bacterium GWB2_35_12]|nr:MAG: preprotein translocase subunit SecA [Ignavibacteria bacterium GWB2_35_12]OGV21486.1 MAG: preprotein translocase subunit SecA [Ignavibacteria bacterium RIFOXYC2_FULL_35_21]